MFKTNIDIVGEILNSIQTHHNTKAPDAEPQNFEEQNRHSAIYVCNNCSNNT